MLLPHDFPKPHEHNDLEIVLDGVHGKMELDAAFKGILKISKFYVHSIISSLRNE